MLKRIHDEGVATVSADTGIPKSTLYYWHDHSPAANGRYRKPGGGRKPFLSSDLELRISNWILTQRKAKLFVPRQSILDKAKLLGNFSPTDRWLSGFLKRHNLSLRVPTVASNNLYPKDQLQATLTSFWKDVLELRFKYNLSADLIGNMDEVPVYIESLPRVTVAKRGSRTVVCKSAGQTKSRITVVLSCTAAGTKLPPMIIFKGLTKRCIKGVVASTNRALLTFQKNAYSSEELSQTWIKDIWLKHTKNCESLLIWDKFSGHVACYDKYKNKKLHQALIPASCTPIVQPLDVSVIKSFKTKFRQLQTQFRDRRLDSVVPRPTKQLVVNWVLAAWNNVSRDIVTNSFKVCGISNNLNGSEEDQVHVNIERLQSD